MRLDAIRTLDRTRDRNRDPFAEFPWYRAILALGDGIESCPGFEIFRGKIPHFLEQLHVRSIVIVFAHLIPPAKDKPYILTSEFKRQAKPRACVDRVHQTW